MMKKHLPLIFALLLAGSVCAQPGSECHRKHREAPKIEEMVSNLTQMQKKKLESLTAERKKQVDMKRAELDAVRKEIRNLLDKEGDQSAKLFPLMEREADIKAEIGKIMYRTRLKIDDVLTKEQITELRANLKVLREKREAENKVEESQAKEPVSAAPKTVKRKPSKLPPAKK